MKNMFSFFYSFILLILLLTYLAVGYVYVEYSVDTLVKQKYEEVSNDMKRTLPTFINEKKEAILLMSIFLSNNESVKKALLTQNVNGLNFKKFESMIKEYTGLNNIWFHVVTSDGKSFYRSWTEHRGDSLLKARKDIVKFMKHPEVSSLISTGKFDITFKATVPIYNNKKFIGAIETIARFCSIINKMKSKGYETVLFVDKSYKKQLTKAITKVFIHDYYVSTKNANKTIIEIFKQRYLQILTTKNYLLDKKNNLLISTYKLPDIDAKDMGIFIMTKKLDEIDMSDIDYYKQNVIMILFIIALLTLLIAYYVYSINYKKFIQKHNERLKNDVKLKTKELYYTAHHDELTGLPNRTLLLDRLKQVIKYSSRRDYSIFILFLDLDRFKEVNDTYGHNIGDELLKKVATILENSVRSEDTVARLGGDEFTIILQNIEHNSLLKIVTKIINNMKKVIRVNDINLYTTFSIGIAKFPDDGVTTDILLRNADTAMYKAKENGKNNYYFYNKEMTSIAQKRLTLEGEIREALLRHEFEVYFQPKIDVKRKKVIGLEALVRWNHPQKGLLFPDTFIPFSQEIGLIHQIDRYVMRKSMHIAKVWLNKGYEFGKISLNASASDLDKLSYVDEIEAELKLSGYTAEFLEIEILESQSMHNQDKVIEVLQKIRDLGVKISVDDFGTGYSSLSYIKMLPINTIKIDRSFIQDLPDDKDSRAIVRTIITLTENLDLDVIAEGVETEEQVDFLVAEGCHNIQGYYFFKPLQTDYIEKILRDGMDSLDKMS